MPKIQASLPDYNTLVRWTVQDVINWLENNGFKCGKLFRQAGVDGNKFVHCQSADLRNIKCSKDEIKDIMDQLRTVKVPNALKGISGGSHGGHFQQQTPNPDFDSESDDGGWDSDFDDDPEPAEPVAPARPNRRTPPSQPRSEPPAFREPPRRVPAPEPEEPQELYEDPDNTGPPVTSIPPRRPPVSEPVEEEEYEDPDAHKQNFQTVRNMPLPTPPSERSAPGHGNRPPPPLPNTRSAPAPPPQIEENYIDPDVNDKPPTPPPPRNGKRGGPSIPNSRQDKPVPPPINNIPRRHSDEVKPVEEETYEDPDGRVDSLPDYMEPDVPTAPPPRPGKAKAVPSKRPPPKLVQEETYEEPDRNNQEQETYEEPEQNQNIVEEVYEIPESRDDENQEQYLEMELEDIPTTVAPQLPQPVQPRRGRGRSPAPPPTPVSTPAPAKTSHNMLQLPSRTPKSPSQTALEDYENPPDKVENAQRDVQRAVGNVISPTTNGYVDRPRSPRSPRSTRELPPRPNAASSSGDPDPAPSDVNSSKEPTEGQLLMQRWYHGSISRDEAKKQLAAHRFNGMYLIRRSTKNPDQPFTLQIWYGDSDYNLPIKKSTEGTYVVGGNKQKFKSLLDIVNGFKKSKLVLNKAVETSLEKSLPKQKS
ncbi:uncharacterized protein LOC128211079 isoform X3 [Mya arenaria]|uniref:uncharacterized protein LOC128211079 isoform X3 n=1 Tax=Mya arenaria TaxID=6604 RepID=UPI0022E96F0F|nr:uncharacterized protein LOC128211079 isoform X3 [Mya arenaria]